MFNFYLNLNVITQTFIASLFTFIITSLGSAVVFFFKKVNKSILDLMLSLSAGIMISASFWSLLNPAVDIARELKINGETVITIGFILGGLFLILTNKFFDTNLNKYSNLNKFRRSFLLISSIILHNIPEGMAIGIAFGSITNSCSNVTSALMLAIGIGIQNFPEGAAVSLPLRREGYSQFKAFSFGVLSGIVEPIFAILGCLLSTYAKMFLPLFLSFAAGAMILVVESELIPECQNNKHKNLINLFIILGFSLMMFLDVKFN